LAVAAELRISDIDTLPGSFRISPIVFSAALFCAHVVPVGGEALAVVDGPGPLGERAGRGGGGRFVPIPRPGTVIPAVPNLPTAASLSKPWDAESGASLLRGGSLGGRGGFAVGLGETDVDSPLPAVPVLGGGLGKRLTSMPVVLATKGPVLFGGASASGSGSGLEVASLGEGTGGPSFGPYTLVLGGGAN